MLYNMLYNSRLCASKSHVGEGVDVDFLSNVYPVSYEHNVMVWFKVTDKAWAWNSMKC